MLRLHSGCSSAGTERGFGNRSHCRRVYLLVRIVLIHFASVEHAAARWSEPLQEPLPCECMSAVTFRVRLLVDPFVSPHLAGTRARWCALAVGVTTPSQAFN